VRKKFPQEEHARARVRALAWRRFVFCGTLLCMDLTSELDELDELERRLRELDTRPIVFVPTVRKPHKLQLPLRVPLQADSPEKLVEVLGLNPQVTDLSFDAGLLAFAARNPGQAKKMPQEWHEKLWSMGASYTIPEWLEACRVAELIARHKYVHTPMAPKPYQHPASAVEPIQLPEHWILPPPPDGRKKQSKKSKESS
jgi:hypothetical protein